MGNEHGRPLVVGTIEVDGDTDPPEGRIVADGSVYEFHGWLGLAVALGGAIVDARSPVVPPPEEVQASEQCRS